MIGTAKNMLWILSMALLICGYGGNDRVSASTGAKQSRKSIPRSMRIISTSPSITESLFAIGLGKNVVGVTEYCNYPREALKIAKIGGFIDPNPEAIVRLKPDIIFVHDDRRQQFRRLEQIGLRVVVIRQRSVDDIMNVLLQMGKACNALPKAEAVVRSMRQKIAHIQRKTAGKDKPSVLICVGMGGSPLDRVYVAGRKNFFNDIIEMVGGVNACHDSVMEMPSMTAEGLIRLNPRIVIDLVPNTTAYRSNVGEEKAKWKKLTLLGAVRNNKVFILTKEYIVVPGPRFINTLDDVARIVHPEIDWKKP